MTDTIQLTVEGPRLYVKSPYSAIDIMKAHGSGRWCKKTKRWWFPAFPDNVTNLLHLIKTNGYNVFIAEELYCLLWESLQRNEWQNNNLKMISPDKINKQLWRHQQTGFSLAMQLNSAMLAMDMGTGKTLTTLAVIATTGAKKVLVFAPRYVVPVWAEQAEQHMVDPPWTLPLGCGKIADRLELLKQKINAATERDQALMVVLNYDAVNASPSGKGAKRPSNLLQDYLLQTSWDIIVADEIHKLKQPGGSTSKFFAKLRDCAARRIGLSGTPAPNTWADIYGQYRFLSPDIFGLSYTRFKSEFFIEDEWGGIKSIANEQELFRRFYRIAYRVEADDVLDLPPSTDIVLKCDLEDSARRRYNELESQYITEVQTGVITAANGAVKLIRLLQLTGGWLTPETDDIKKPEPVRVSKAKGELLKELLDDLPVDEPVVVFTYFIQDIETVRHVAEKQGRRVAELSGRVNDEQYQAWRRGDYDVLIIQIRAGSLGIECTRARIAVIYTLGLISPGDWDQAQRRIVRPGQTKPVTFYYLQCRSTKDVTVYRALQNKTNVIKYILDEMRKGAS